MYADSHEVMPFGRSWYRRQSDFPNDSAPTILVHDELERKQIWEGQPAVSSAMPRRRAETILSRKLEAAKIRVSSNGNHGTSAEVILSELPLDWRTQEQLSKELRHHRRIEMLGRPNHWSLPELSMPPRQRARHSPICRSL